MTLLMQYWVIVETLTIINTCMSPLLKETWIILCPHPYMLIYLFLYFFQIRLNKQPVSNYILSDLKRIINISIPTDKNDSFIQFVYILSKIYNISTNSRFVILISIPCFSICHIVVQNFRAGYKIHYSVLR